MPTIFADPIKASVLNLAIGSCLTGMFLILGLQYAIQGQALGALVLMAPLMAVVSIGHAARIMRGVAALQRSGSAT